jgi:hypothetical protein
LVRKLSSDYCASMIWPTPSRSTSRLTFGAAVLGLRWTDYDDAAGTLTITGKVVRMTGRAWAS